MYSDRENAPLALSGVTFSTHPGEKLGIVGRTGAGKSSLLHALLRLAPPRAGATRIDGVDVATLHLHALRSISLSNILSAIIDYFVLYTVKNLMGMELL